MYSLDEIEIRRATLAEIIDLRHDVLRHGLPRESAIFPGDDAPTTFHCGAFVVADGRNAGCATLHLSTWEERPAYQLRGMATHADFRGCGVGRELMRFVEQNVIDDPSGIRWMWCNARVPAIRFYESVGWHVVSDEFEIPTAGPHHRMIKRLP
jgi:GNAT superfamily N-acetyltransferase